MTATANPGTLRQFREFARQMGLAYDQMLDPDHAEVMARLDEKNEIPAAATVNVLQACADASHRPDLGLAFASWINLRKLGPLSLLWDHCATVSEAMAVSSRYLHLESAAVGLEIIPEGDEVAFVHNLLVTTKNGGSQFLTATLTSTVRVIRLVLGESWNPLAVELGHSALEDDRLHRRFFRAPIRYGAERYAIICQKADLYRNEGNGNPQMLRFVETHLSGVARQWPQDLVSQVDHLVTARLAGGQAALPTIASMLAMSARTLQRRLSAEGTDYGRIVSEVRVRRVHEYYRDEVDPNLSQLAYLLGLSDASAASRFLKEKLSSTGRDLRAAAAAGRRAAAALRGQAPL